MNREIKFRAWNRNDGMSNPFNLMDLAHHYDNDYFVRHWGVLRYDIFTTNATIMQYTGLKDKNGVEIYEGDIVSHPNKHFLAPVKFGLGTYDSGCYEYQGFYVDAWSEMFMKDNYKKNGKDSDGTGGLLLDTANIEVIGNIYEHSHLLKK